MEHNNNKNKERNVGECSKQKKKLLHVTFWGSATMCEEVRGILQMFSTLFLSGGNQAKYIATIDSTFKLNCAVFIPKQFCIFDKCIGMKSMVRLIFFLYYFHSGKYYVLFRRFFFCFVFHSVNYIHYVLTQNNVNAFWFN